MTEDPIRKDVREIKYRISDTEKSVGLLLRANRNDVIQELMESCFRKSIEKIKVFLAIDGESSISVIAEKLHLKLPNVSRHIQDFVDHDLIGIKNTEGSKKIFEKTSQVRRLRLDKFLQDTFKDQLEIKPEETSSNAESNGEQSSSTIPDS